MTSFPSLPSVQQSPLSALSSLRSTYIARCRAVAAEYLQAAAAFTEANDPALARFCTLRAADNQETADLLECAGPPALSPVPPTPPSSH